MSATLMDARETSTSKVCALCTISGKSAGQTCTPLRSEGGYVSQRGSGNTLMSEDGMNAGSGKSIARDKVTVSLTSALAATPKQLWPIGSPMKPSGAQHSSVGRFIAATILHAATLFISMTGLRPRISSTPLLQVPQLFCERTGETLPGAVGLAAPNSTRTRSSRFADDMRPEEFLSRRWPMNIGFTKAKLVPLCSGKPGGMSNEVQHR